MHTEEALLISTVPKVLISPRKAEAAPWSNNLLLEQLGSQAKLFLRGRSGKGEGGRRNARYILGSRKSFPWYGNAVCAMNRILEVKSTHVARGKALAPPHFVLRIFNPLPTPRDYKLLSPSMMNSRNACKIQIAGLVFSVE